MTEVTLGAVPFQEAIDHFRDKLNLPTEYWDQLTGQAHAKAFTVAGATKTELLHDIRSLVDDAIADGTSISDFRKGFDKAVAKHGWDFNGKRGWRTRVIYDTNLRTAHAAGKWEQIQRVKDRRPYMKYEDVGDGRVRELHAEWGKMSPLLVDDPWWNTHYPPNGWGCRCGVRTLSQRQMENEGLTVGEAPPLNPTERINVKSGEVYGEVPKGIDPGWDYNVGQEWLRFDKSARLPDCSSGGLFDFAISKTPCIALLGGQKTWRDHGRLDLRDVAAEHRIAAPEMLPRAESVDEAVSAMKAALGMTAAVRSVRTPVNETVVFDEDFLPHLVAKRADARERYSNFILPTLLTPYEVYLTEYGDGWRSRYIGLFQGKNDLLVVVRRNQDGSLFWNIMQAKDKKMNQQRVGELVYKVGE